ncbi:MAG TPA: DUF1501 domain-containing protein [Gemmataceae bacterium]|jgi:hypothetical protein|nr:DUF1501 domain-containing protein [Gemmataceae bacterium]
MLTRRGFVQTGYAATLGLTLAGASPRARANDRPAKAKSVIIVYLTGACSHIDTFDMKPDAPAEIRGQFKPIASSVPGLQVCEHLPHLAKRMDRCALVRSLAHREDNHLLATHQVLTGTAIPGGKFDQIASRNDWPCYASGLDHHRPRTDGVPTGVTLPTFLMEGPLIWPGQHAGFLGAKHDPWHIKEDPNRPGFRVEALQSADGPGRFQGRHNLLEEIARAGGGSLADRSPMAEQQERAFTILSSGKVAEAFDLSREPTQVRDRYGRHAYGQSLLLARRLVEAGVSVVQANMGHVQTWDNHGAIFPTLKDRLLPPTDRGVSALIDDLQVRGLLDETLVVMFGEFGRTPKVNAGAGRDHWGRAFFACFWGGGVTGGAVIGKTDAIGSDPVTPAYSPMDFGATIYSALGVDHGAEVRDQLKRPVALNTGKPIAAIYA